jgi:hypothetical protein
MQSVRLTNDLDFTTRAVGGGTNSTAAAEQITARDRAYVAKIHLIQ